MLIESYNGVSEIALNMSARKQVAATLAVDRLINRQNSFVSCRHRLDSWRGGWLSWLMGFMNGELRSFLPS